MEKQDRIYISGHQGLVGSAILRQLENRGFGKIITKKRSELDLTIQEQVRLFFDEYVRLNTFFYGTPYANPNNQPIMCPPAPA